MLKVVVAVEAVGVSSSSSSSSSSKSGSLLLKSGPPPIETSLWVRSNAVSSGGDPGGEERSDVSTSSDVLVGLVADERSTETRLSAACRRRSSEDSDRFMASARRMALYRTWRQTSKSCSV